MPVKGGTPEISGTLFAIAMKIEFNYNSPVSYRKPLILSHLRVVIVEILFLGSNTLIVWLLIEGSFFSVQLSALSVTK